MSTLNCLVAAVVALASTKANAEGTLEQFLRDLPPQIFVADQTTCAFGFSLGSFRLTGFPGTASSAPTTLEVNWKEAETPKDSDLAAIDAACPKGMRWLVELAAASCHEDDAFGRMLQQTSTFALAIPRAPAAVAGTRRDRGYFLGSEGLGCARSLRSRDGRVRIWTQIGEELVIDQDGRGRDYVLRSPAFVQWTDDQGEVHVWKDGTSADLHLDAILDAIEPLPGRPGSYLVLGLRAFRATYPGSLPRRFAEVIQLPTGPEASRPKLVRGAFSSGRVETDMLLLSSVLPKASDYSFKFRHDPMAHRWLAFDAASGELRLQPIPGYEARDSYGQPTRLPDPVAVAAFKGGKFRLLRSSMGDIRTAKAWAKVKERRERLPEE